MGKLTFSMGGVHPHDSKYARDIRAAVKACFGIE